MKTISPRIVLTISCVLSSLLAASSTACSGADGADEDPNAEGALTGSRPVVHTKAGDVRAGDVKDGIARFIDVPFAAPPVKDLRWKPPATVKPWEGVRASGEGKGISCAEQEDCLYLDVYAPSAKPSSALPILFFMHGGYGISGSKGVIDGAKLAKAGNLIVVSTNYRLASLGYYTSPALTQEQGTSGNYAHLDQIAALQWVKENIAAFGGDPQRVTISGQSWGGMSTCVLTASPLAKGLFSGAINISGPDCLTQTQRQAYNVWKPMGDAFDCPAGANQLECLRKVPAAKVYGVLPNGLDQWPYGWRTAIDGNFLPDTPENIFAAGKQNKVATMIGATSEESSSKNMAKSIFPDEGTPIARWNEDKYKDALSTMYGSKASKVLAHYPVASYKPSANGTASTNAAMAERSDEIFVCPDRHIARSLVAHQREPVYRYIFGLTGSFPTDFDQPNGHGTDLKFLFRSAEEEDSARGALKIAIGKVQDTVTGYWSRFVATGDPNGGGAPKWPAYDRAKDNTMMIDDPPHMQEGVSTDNCDFWDTVQGR